MSLLETRLLPDENPYMPEYPKKWQQDFLQEYKNQRRSTGCVDFYDFFYTLYYDLIYEHIMREVEEEWDEDIFVEHFNYFSEKKIRSKKEAQSLDVDIYSEAICELVSEELSDFCVRQEYYEFFINMLEHYNFCCYSEGHAFVDPQVRLIEFH